MSKINLTLSGELVFEYNEDGSKTSDVCLKTKSGKLIPLGIKIFIAFKKHNPKNSDLEIDHVTVSARFNGDRLFKTHEEAVKYILSCIEKQGYEVNEEVILNYDI